MENDYLCQQKGPIMNRQPQLMDVTRMRDILTPHLSQMCEHVFLNSELAIVRGDHTVFSLLMRQKPPFTINDHRFGIVISGEADINFNLQDRHLTSGTLVYIGPGTIIHPQRLSSDLRIFGMGLFSNFPMRSGARLPVVRQRRGYRYRHTYYGRHLANGSCHGRLSSSHRHSTRSCPDAPLRPAVPSAD